MAIVMKATNSKYRTEHGRIFGSYAKAKKSVKEFMKNLENSKVVTIVGTCPKCQGTLGKDKETGDVQCISCKTKFTEA